METEGSLVTLDDIRAARSVVTDHVHRTPIITSSYLSAQTDLDLRFKAELFQKTGSFKPRGVLNKIHHLTNEERDKGVITISAGNHGQALAWGASQVGVAATVVMPENAVRSKVEATRQYGGEVVLTERGLLETMEEIRAERGLMLVHPFDDPHIIAGQGTVGLEVMEDAPDVEAVVVGVGGGGLISGIATAVKGRRPETLVYGVEPEGASAMSQSLERGEVVHLDGVDTVADGLAPPFAGEHTLAHVRARVDEVVIVKDDEILEAMRLILERCKVLAEPAAAAPLAALLTEKLQLPSGARTVCVLSGGNIDSERLKSYL